MQNVKYLFFYALLAVIVALGFMGLHWIVIFPAALVLSFAYITVKGSSWRQVMGQADLNPSIVFIGVMMSQILLAAILWGIGWLAATLFS